MQSGSVAAPPGPAETTAVGAVAAAPGPNDPNRTVWEYLASYCRALRPPGYAVLLVGPWGTGKTFFVKKLLKDIGQPHLLITLNGVTSTADIDAQIFRQLHPFLSSKVARLGGVLAKGLLKGTLKIDLNDDSKDDGTLSVGLPDVKIQEFAKSAEGRVLVFDDLERCRMKLEEALGYINGFVEHEEMKAIVIANAEEIEKNNQGFSRIKEKLIGQTLELKPHVEAAYPELVDTLGETWAATFLRAHAAEALLVFSLSGTSNLRALRQALQDFDRFASALRTTDRVHDQSLVGIMQTILALSLDFRTGRLSAEDLQATHNRLSRWLGRDKEKVAEPFEQSEQRYKDIDLRSPWLDGTVIKGLFVQGWIDPNDVHKSLDQAPPFISASQEPAWRRAWHGYERPDDEFEAAMGEVDAGFGARSFTHPGEILHVFGLKLIASEIGLNCVSTEEVVAEGKAYIDDLLKSDALWIPEPGEEELRMHSGYGGLAFQERDREAFKDLRAYLETAMSSARAARLPLEAQRLLATLTADPDAFQNSIRVGSGGRAHYWDVPVLQHIPPSAFAAELLKLAPERQHGVLAAMKDRYGTGSAQSKLAPELPWITGLKNSLEAELPNLRPMSRHRISGLIKGVLEPAITTLGGSLPSPSISPTSAPPPAVAKKSVSTAAKPTRGGGRKGGTKRAKTSG